MRVDNDEANALVRVVRVYCRTMLQRHLIHCWVLVRVPGCSGQGC
jgi:hypothetical protein